MFKHSSNSPMKVPGLQAGLDSCEYGRKYQKSYPPVQVEDGISLSNTGNEDESVQSQIYNDNVNRSEHRKTARVLWSRYTDQNSELSKAKKRLELRVEREGVDIPGCRRYGYTGFQEKNKLEDKHESVSIKSDSRLPASLPHLPVQAAQDPSTGIIQRRSTWQKLGNIMFQILLLIIFVLLLAIFIITLILSVKISEIHNICADMHQILINII